MKKNIIKRKLTKKLLYCVLFFILINGFYSLSVSAHPASDMKLFYNTDSNVLDVSITHQVSNPETHFIYNVIIRKNGDTYNNYEYTSQPTNSNFTYSYEVNTSKGDIIEVFIDCNLGGSLTKQLTVTSQRDSSSKDSSFSILDITYYRIFGVPFIVYLGLITLFIFIFTAGLAILKRKVKINYPIKWHFWLSYVAIILGMIHGILGILTYII